MTSYQHFDAKLTGRNALRRKVANNTYAERRGDDRIAIRLHGTDVVTYDRDGTITLDTGGWYTVTTKERMNSLSPLRIWSNRGEWTVGKDGEAVLYADGMTWHPERGFAGHRPESDAARLRKERAKLNAEIKAFVGSITPEQIVRAWENTGGDCFICRFDMPGHDDHIASHLEERYFHAHLALRAIKARGFHDPDFAMAWIYREAQDGKVNKHFLTDSLTKYLRKQLTTGVAVR